MDFLVVLWMAERTNIIIHCMGSKTVFSNNFDLFIGPGILPG